MKKNVVKRESDNNNLNKYFISLYLVPPTWEVSLEEFESSAIRRLNLLQEVDSSYAKSGKNDGVLRSIVRKYYNDEDEKTDILSHFTLRLSYSKQRESEQYWWITQEARLLKLRFHCMENDIALDIYNKKSPLSLITSLLSINFPNISESDFQLYKSDLTFLLRKKYRNKNDVLVNNLNNVSHLDFFQLPFEKGAQFLSSKNNLIVKGFIYVYKNELISIIINLFREHLQKSLELYRTAQFYSSSSSSSNSSQANSSQGSSQGGSSQGGSQGGVSFTAFEEDNDERIQPIVKSLSHLTSTTPIDFDVKKEGEGIDISQLDFLSTQSYPLCMKHIHSNLRKSHKLKHTGRMQYGLFLKGIGLSLEESMQFWRLEFTKVMQQKKFDSEGYAYSIRHNYGKEGKLTNYSPYSCAKIIHDSSSQTNGEHAHGCPFKNWDKSQLTSSLRSSGLSSFQIDDIISDLSQFQYQGACRKYYGATHPGAQDFVVNHPNQFFKRSFYYHKKPLENPADNPNNDNNNNKNNEESNKMITE